MSCLTLELKEFAVLALARADRTHSSTRRRALQLQLGATGARGRANCAGIVSTDRAYLTEKPP